MKPTPKGTRFAGYPSAQIFEQPTGKKPIQHLLWGDWLRVTGKPKGDFYPVHGRGCDGWMHKDSIQTKRLLEVVFVDIGQGDGCLVVTPGDKHMLIDAGQRDNMMRFLKWRYGGFKTPCKFECAIISHSDADHYGGFKELFDQPNISFGTVFSNGLMERTGPDPLGKVVKKGQHSYAVELVPTMAKLKAFLKDPTRWARKLYPTMLHQGLEAKSFKDFRMLSVEDGELPRPKKEAGLSFSILGPVMETVNKKKGLRWFGPASQPGKTKNGHSVVVRVTYKNIRLLLGGDLNIPSEDLLLEHHTGIPCPPAASQRQAVIDKARQVFGVDIAKACHHGSADFSDTFLAAVSPLATVISSGDDEPHAHPRADTLGTIGRHARGERPLIFSTELARSAKESIKHPNVLRQQLRSLRDLIDESEDADEKTRLIKKYDKLVDTLDRSVAVYGAIQLRTDGEKVVLAQKLERNRAKPNQLIKWDIYQLEPDSKGQLHYLSKH